MRGRMHQFTSPKDPRTSFAHGTSHHCIERERRMARLVAKFVVHDPESSCAEPPSWRKSERDNHLISVAAAMNALLGETACREQRRRRVALCWVWRGAAT